mmetsp:Transcript_14872/g.30028  ORF Transcript_14872/g.30028 Transcript_14872/m.30028 type:complete len:144 (+) Transcript_14872:877-1308(+)
MESLRGRKHGMTGRPILRLNKLSTYTVAQTHADVRGDALSKTDTIAHTSTKGHAHARVLTHRHRHSHTKQCTSHTDTQTKEESETKAGLVQNYRRDKKKGRERKGKNAQRSTYGVCSHLSLSLSLSLCGCVRVSVSQPPFNTK